MRGIFNVAVATVVTLVTQTFAAPIVVTPGGPEDIVITEENTLNATTFIGNATRAASLKISLTNNFNGGAVNVYVSGLDPTGAVVMVGTDGAWYHPNAGGSGVPVPINGNIKHSMGGRGSVTDIVLPDYMSSGRVWIAEGDLQFFTVASEDGRSLLVEPSAANPSDPSAGVNWGFVELTNNDGGIYANISFVDFVGLVVGMTLRLASGITQTVKGLAQGAAETICNEMRAQAAQDGQPWDRMCVTDPNGRVLRVQAPNLYLAGNPTAQQDYYTDYTNRVWAKYTNEDLLINTQAAAGTVACRVSGTDLQCAGDNRGYPKPTTADIWGCNSGPFAIHAEDNDVHRAVVPRLCAAFHRTELLIPGGNRTPSQGARAYYTQNPTSHYSRLVHKHEIDQLGYAFSYDDVNPDGQNAAGVVAGPNPTVLELTVGGFSN